MPWLIARLRRERSAARPADRHLHDEAIAAAQGYARTRRQTPEAERDGVLLPPVAVADDRCRGASLVHELDLPVVALPAV
ncbi:hypothetical protein ACFV30_11480 [Streptomyces sp. NPDC059752]|uniref:hypothetical protein n=1 Tax=unclassified Streptomyces TaxID=2593676 RepID=UPI00364E1BD5